MAANADAALALPFALPAGHTAALRLPHALTARAFGPAWAVALAVHVLLAAAALLAPSPQPVEEPLVRLVYLEPPPPPPAPLGAPDGGGTVAAQVAPVQPQTPIERREEQVKPIAPDTTRLRKIEAKAKPKPKPAAPPKPVVAAQQPQPAPVAEVAPGVATGSVGGAAGGVVGGVAGGLPGGVVGGTGTGPIPAGQAAHRPQLVHRVPPTYPEPARRRAVEGLVLLEAILDRDGRVEAAVKILKSIPMLDAEAIAAVRQWRFRPARNQGGDPVRVILEIPIRFTLR